MIMDEKQSENNELLDIVYIVSGATALALGFVICKFYRFYKRHQLIHNINVANIRDNRVAPPPNRMNEDDMKNNVDIHISNHAVQIDDDDRKKKADKAVSGLYRHNAMDSEEMYNDNNNVEEIVGSTTTSPGSPGEANI